MATTKKGEVKLRYKETTVKNAGVEQALLRKELKRFTSSANYMMNCGLGLVFMVVAAVFLLIKGDLILQYIPLLSSIDEGIVPMGMTAMVCMMTSMNDITAPSISLEGKNLWILQVLPVDPWKVLKAKIQLQLMLSAIPMLFLIVSMLIVVRPEAGFVIVMPITVVLFAVFMALLGLVLNLKAPNLTWTNEIVPIKQSMSVMLTMFGGMGLVLGFGVGYYLLMDVVDALIYMIGVDVLLASATIGFVRWLKYKGSKIFASL
jgi:ABC-2 type transport system permease protein